MKNPYSVSVFYIHTIEKSVHISAKVTRKSERGGVLALQPDDTSGSYSMRGIDTTTAVYATLYDVSSHLTAVQKPNQGTSCPFMFIVYE